MNLGKLLAAGNGIMNGREGISYRSSKQACLPKFSNKSLFSKSPAAELPRSEAKESVVAPSSKRPASNMTKTQKLPAVSLAANGKARLAEKLRHSRNWFSKLNPFVSRNGLKPPIPTTAADGMKTPAQTELSLDAVKVLRNDLCDADVEIVPLKSRSQPENAAPVLQPAKSSWELLGERLLGVEVT